MIPKPVPGSDQEDVLVVFVHLIITQFILYPEKNKNGDCHAQSKTKNVNEGMHFVPGHNPHGYFDMMFKKRHFDEI
jgi:hypothetical protein